MKTTSKRTKFEKEFDYGRRGNGVHELQRFAELGRLSASLLHEISNPLTAALLHLEMSDQKSPSVRKAKRDIQLLRRYVDAARQHARQESKPARFPVISQFEQLKRVINPLARHASVQLEFGDLPRCQLFGDPVKFQHIFANLIINAIEAYNDDGTKHQASLVKISFHLKSTTLTVQVKDWGRGISAAELPKVFEPFYTTKDHASHGLGIGLAIVEQYATVDFRGSIKVSSSRRKGTQFTIRLPLGKPQVV